ncbi:RagB/SusD family nutrient uptake outer membrane protein [Chitinophaga sp. NPDC101104]|uniref:RagB/SusD family nutrient uptake outer membrane protein n=1 Tax=Chitinophaga sp. NPDC101104 TaxID=3390561 RepID=UPI003D005168
MKKTILYIFLVSTTMACKKSWLEIVPMGQRVATNVKDYELMMNDPAYYLYAWSGGWQEPLFMGDEIAAEGSYFLNRNLFKERLFQWADSIYRLSEETAPAINLHNSQLYNLNKIINEVMETEGGTPQQKSAIRAEALATRAWSYFNMANYYCKPYVAATAAADAGFPIITMADVNVAEFSRGTLQQTYDFIISDLKEAIKSLPATPPVATHMSRPAAEGLLGKVYLFMGKPAEALPYLESALAQVSANGSPTLYDYNETLAPGGSFLPIDIMNGPRSPFQNPSDVREAVVSKVWNCGPYVQFTQSGLVLTQEAAALYGAGDLRLQFYTARNPDNTPNAAGRLRKYGLQYARFGLQLPELYLLSAECKARTGNLAGAVADVETLRRHRMPVANAAVPATTAVSQNALVKFIIDERVREFAMEGYRWFDMRRLSVDPLYAGFSAKHTIYHANGTVSEYTLSLPNRLVLKLPRNIMDGNPGMANNP